MSQAASPPPGSPAPLALLVVDDEAEMLEVMAEALRDLSPLVLQAGNAAAAMELLRQNPGVGAVVTDIRMPQTDGLTLLRQMMAERGEGPAALTVVMVTGHAGLEAARQAMRDGAVEFLTKPFSRGELHDAVRHALGLARARRAQAVEHDSRAQALALALSAAARPAAPGSAGAVQADQRAVLAHGLRSPLVPMVGLAEVLQQPDLPRAQIQQFARYIAEGADQLHHNVNRLLDFDGLAHGAIPMRPQPVAASRVAAEAVVRVAPLARAGQVTLAPAVPEALMLCADPDWLAWALAELMTNAVRVSPPGARVVLAAAPAPGGGACFAVTDQGPGLPDALLHGKRLPFASAEPVRNRSSTSLGLGLAIVERIAELHGGSLALGRLPQGGSEARLQLPG